jgi:hypothetical protein
MWSATHLAVGLELLDLHIKDFYKVEKDAEERRA